MRSELFCAALRCADEDLLAQELRAGVSAGTGVCTE